MQLINWFRRPIAPYVIFLFGVTLLFSIASTVPYQIVADPVPQIKGIYQWLNGETSFLNFYVNPDPNDLSQNIQTWHVWHAPGVSFVFFPLIALGLPLGIAARTTAYFLYCIGGWGWIKVAAYIPVCQKTKLTLSLLLILYYILMGSAFVLGGDTIPFAIFPWLLLYAIRLTSQGELPTKLSTYLGHCVIFGFLLGIMYWLKYSAFISCLGLLLYLAIYLLFLFDGYSLIKRLALVGSSTVSCLLPVLSLNIMHRIFSGFNTAVEQYESTEFASSYTEGWGLFLSWIASFSLGVFNYETLAGRIGYFLFISTDIKATLSSLSFYYTEPFKFIIGIMMTILFFVIVFLLKAHNFYTKKIKLIWVCITVFPLILLAYLSHRVNYNFLLSSISRYTFPCFILSVTLLINSYFKNADNVAQPKYFKKILGFGFAVLIFLPQISHNVAHSVNNMLLRHNYISTDSLWIPAFSRVNSKSVIEEINSRIQSSKDVILFALDASRGSESLAVKHRNLSFSLADRTPFHTSQDLRVIVVISKSLESDQDIVRFNQKLPQATEWHRVSDIPDAEVSIWYSDLKAAKN